MVSCRPTDAAGHCCCRIPAVPAARTSPARSTRPPRPIPSFEGLVQTRAALLVWHHLAGPSEQVPVGLVPVVAAHCRDFAALLEENLRPVSLLAPPSPDAPACPNYQVVQRLPAHHRWAFMRSGGLPGRSRAVTEEAAR